MKTGKCPDDLFLRRDIYLSVSLKKINYTLNGYAGKAVTPGSYNKQNNDLFKKQGLLVCANSSLNANVSEKRDILYLQLSHVFTREF